jgi:hypothetical protein
MSRYTKTIDLWENGMIESIHKGSLTLQCGQWVYCGDKSHKSRFVAYSNGILWVAHWEGKKDTTKATFNRYVRIIREHNKKEYELQSELYEYDN